MELNYSFIVIAAIAAVALIAFLIWRNQIDKKDMEDEIIRSESKPEGPEEDDSRV
ncbi:hypothetical protein ACFQ3S_02200 [Mucilaginibacter terrae]|uniref:hypothetical protein n=1 Tax=Mucilaginibacter terrae TaxID=1955052 RepID=UPI00362E6C82